MSLKPFGLEVELCAVGGAKDTEVNFGLCSLDQLYVLITKEERGRCSGEESVGMEGCSFLPSAALFYYRHQPMNYTESMSTSIIEGRGFG